jgi:hypothetical protein
VPFFVRRMKRPHKSSHFISDKWIVIAESGEGTRQESTPPARVASEVGDAGLLERHRLPSLALLPIEANELHCPVPSLASQVTLDVRLPGDSDEGGISRSGKTTNLL